MNDTVFATEEVTAKMGELAAWARIFVAEQPSDVSLVDDKQGEKVSMSEIDRSLRRNVCLATDRARICESKCTGR